MKATFDIGKKTLELLGIGDAEKINEIRKGMGWKLVSLSVRVCDPVKCAICGKLVAKEDREMGNRFIIAEYGYKVLDGTDREVCSDCWDHEERYYLTEDEMVAHLEGDF